MDVMSDLEFRVESQVTRIPSRKFRRIYNHSVQLINRRGFPGSSFYTFAPAYSPKKNLWYGEATPL